MMRWLVEIDYRSDNGPVTVYHEIEELSELADLVKQGQDWNTIQRIDVILNPHRRTL